MRKFSTYILFHVVLMSILCACQNTDIIETYDELKDENLPALLSFEPYVFSGTETDASTRADLSYLSYIENSTNQKLIFFNYIPCLGLKTGSSLWYANWDTGYNYRFGRTANNSYIVGIYGYSHGSETWNEAKSLVKSNLMTNQPLLRVPLLDNNGKFVPCTGHNNKNINYQNNPQYLNEFSLWDYEPKKYWPNDKNANVTFIAYYPFQDFNLGKYYRDGTGKHANEKIMLSGTWYWDPDDSTQSTKYDDADLTGITPPNAKDPDTQEQVVGDDAYIFKFRQSKDVQKHIDFLMGMKQYNTRPDGNQVSIKLQHTLCAVEFNFALDNTIANWGHLDGQTIPSELKIKVNSIGFDGLKTQGEVYPTSESAIKWDNLSNYEGDENTYIVEFTDNSGNASPIKPFMQDGIDDRPTFTYSSATGNWTTVNQTRAQIYNKKATQAEGKQYGDNSRGFRYLLLVIPQKVNDNPDAYLKVDYDMSYSWEDDNSEEYNVEYKNNISKVRLSDTAKKMNNDQLFIFGRLLVFNVRFTPKGIQMDAEVKEWPSDEELEVEGEVGSGGE